MNKLTKNTKLFLSYIIPSMVGMLIVGSYSIVDTVFIGQSAGEIGLASVAVTWPLVMPFLPCRYVCLHYRYGLAWTVCGWQCLVRALSCSALSAGYGSVKKEADYSLFFWGDN